MVTYGGSTEAWMGAKANACLTFIVVLCVAIGAFNAQPPDAHAAEDLLGCDGDAAESPWCAERAEALDARAKAEAILATLAQVERPPWSPADLAAANTLYDAGVALFRDEYFGEAALKFAPALAKLQAILERFEDQVTEATVAAAERLNAEEFTEALAGFRQVLMWRPDHEQAQRGAARAETGERVQRTAEEAMRLIEAGEAEQARSLLGTVVADFSPSMLRKARAALRDLDRRTRRNDFITSGHAALDEQDWVTAIDAFRRALDLDAESTAARDGIDQARRGATESELARLRLALATALAQESWTVAVATIGRIAALEPDAPEVRVRLDELERLVALEARLDRTLADTRRAAAKGLRTVTRALIDETRDASVVGERIHGKGVQLDEQFGEWTLPVAVTIRSDNKTDVHVRPGRKLGKLRETRLQVYPGTYTLIGRRSGYREKRVEVTIQPGNAPLVLEVVCDERF